MADAAPQQAAPAPQAQGLGLFGNMPALPQQETLVNLKLLKEVSPELFNEIGQEETLFLKAATSMIKGDAYLRIKLGGDLMTASMNLAKILRSQVEQVWLERRTKTVVQSLVGYKQAELGPAFQPIAGPNAAMNVMGIAQAPVNAFGRHAAIAAGDLVFPNLRRAQIIANPGVGAAPHQLAGLGAAGAAGQPVRGMLQIQNAGI